MAQRDEQGAVTAHAQPGDGTHASLGDGAVGVVDEVHKVLCDEGFVLRFFVDGRIPIPAVFAVGANNNHTVLRSHIG